MMFRAELEKTLRHRIIWIVFGAYLGLNLLILLLGVMVGAGQNGAGGPGGPGGPPADPTSLGEIPASFHVLFGPMFAAVIGAWCGGAEFAWGTWRIVLARDNRRSLHLGVHVAVFALVIVLGFGLAVVALCAIGAVLAALQGGPGGFATLNLLVAGLAGDLAYGFIAFAIALVLRNFGFGLAVALIFQFVEFVGSAVLVMAQYAGPQQWLLTNALDALTGGRSGAAGDGPAAASLLPQIPVGQAWLVVALYLGLTGLVSWASFTRRDLV